MRVQQKFTQENFNKEFLSSILIVEIMLTLYNNIEAPFTLK